MARKKFRGSFEVAVDGKRRVSVPASFRTILGEEPIVIFPSRIPEGALDCRTEDNMESMFDHEISKIDPNAPNRDELVVALETMTNGASHNASVDQNGRFSLPQEMSDKVHITKKCMFVGQGEYFKLYDPSRYKAYCEEAAILLKNAAKRARETPERPADSAAAPHPEDRAGGA